MKQTYTSAATSMNAARLPAIFGRMPTPARHALIFDYGSGKFTEHIRAAMHDVGATYCPYDPFNQPEDVNAASLYYVRVAMHVHMPVTVVCSNVFNVIDSDDQIRDMAGTIRQIVNASGGVGYVTVYEGNRSGEGCQTGPDQWQRNEPLRNYLRFFPSSAYIQNRMIVILPEVTP